VGGDLFDSEKIVHNNTTQHKMEMNKLEVRGRSTWSRVLPHHLPAVR